MRVVLVSSQYQKELEKKIKEQIIEIETAKTSKHGLITGRVMDINCWSSGPEQRDLNALILWEIERHD